MLAAHVSYTQSVWSLRHAHGLSSMGTVIFEVGFNRMLDSVMLDSVMHCWLAIMYGSIHRLTN
jgi:hypothetical protein